MLRLVSIAALFILAACALADIEENPQVLGLTANQECILDQRVNYFQTATSCKIAPRVNPISGEYCEEEVDFVIAGSQPLSVRRFYNHFGPYDPRCASWRYNPETVLVANLEWKGQEIFASVGDTDGSVCSFKPSKQSQYIFDFEVPKGFVIGTDGQSHPLNTTISYWRYGDPKNKQRFQYMCTVKDGSGRIRTFNSPMHPWTDLVQYKEKKIGFGWGSIKSWSVFPNTWTPYYMLVEEERLPNGNILCYTPTKWKEETHNYPLPKLLQTITAYNADKTKILGSITFEYPRVKNDEVGGIKVTGSDARTAYIQHAGKSPILLASANRPGQPSISYGYKDRNLIQLEKPEGRILTTVYQPGSNKVTAQYAPVGPNGEMHPIGRYEYQDQATVVYDAEDYKTIYRFDENKKIKALETYQENHLYLTNCFEWESDTGNLLKKTIKDEKGIPLQITEYEYDKNQNPIMERAGDGKQWRTIYRTYSDDGFNLKMTESDREGKLIAYSYVPNTNLLASELLYEGTLLRKRIFHMYDDCAICIKTITDDGSSIDPYDIRGVTYRKIIEIQPRQQQPCFGLPEIVDEKTMNALGQEVLLHRVVYSYTAFGKILKEEHYDAAGKYSHCISNQYDDREQLIATTDPLGVITKFTYDANYNLTSISGPKTDQYKEITYDKANRPIQITDWQSDGSILITEKRYDKLGRVIEEIDACKNSIRFEYDALSRPIAVYHPDGAVERREYDVLGNVIKEIDPEGYEIQKTYNVFGQVLSIHNPDGSQECFTYNCTGTLHSYTDKNGAITRYTYDIFDRPIKTETLSSSGKSLKTDSTKWSAFNKLCETTGTFTVTYTYDFAGRPLCEKQAYRTIHYSYDARGRLSKTQEGDLVTIKAYDLCNRLTEVRTEANGIVQTKESYGYDEAGNQTLVVHSQGKTTTCFNTYGKPVSIKDALGFTTELTYSYHETLIQTSMNPKGMATQVIHDMSGREAKCIKKNTQGEVIQQYENSYDLNGNKTGLIHTVFAQTTPIKSITHKWDYGPLGRLERFLESSERETRYVYDDRGRLKKIIKPNGCVLTHEYDDLGRLSRFYASDFDYHYSYDQNDRVTSVYDSISKTTTQRSYDPLGLITQEKMAHGLVMTSSYDNQGRRIMLTLPDNSKVSYVYRGAFLYQVSRNNYTHTYSKRNLEGQVLQMDLSADLGKIDLQRDPLGRYTSLKSTYYQASYPKKAYDATGNLLKYSYHDQLGTIDCAYSYDDLDQLVLENEHSYACDSLHNRIKKDTLDYDVDHLCQIHSDGHVSYTYDACGNLLSQGSDKYTYDSLDRLIAIEKGNQLIKYTYDPFHRRLSKTVSDKGGITQQVRYIWDGDHEIGVDEKGVIKELRVLGEGLGAEIGAAVLYELRDKTYIPLHDHRGCVVTLIDPKTKKTIECYRYSAFGEELTNGKISPWRFSSKRVEEETALVFFGRRYYHSKLGRWITQDPEGFKDGPNLYAYVHNNPLCRLDLFGLKEQLAYLLDHDNLDFPGLSYSALLKSGRVNSKFYGFENGFLNKSRFMNLDGEGRLNLPENLGIVFVNGMNNSEKVAKEHLRHLSDLTGGYNLSGIYNASHGTLINIFECAIGLFGGTSTTPVEKIHELWNREFDHGPPDKMIGHFCTSQGAILTKLALQNYPEERRNRIRVIGIAPAAYASRDMCHGVRHYEAKHRDIVTFIDWIGRWRNRDTLRSIPSHPDAGLMDHSFSSPTFEEVIKREVEKMLESVRNK